MIDLAAEIARGVMNDGTSVTASRPTGSTILTSTVLSLPVARNTAEGTAIPKALRGSDLISAGKKPRRDALADIQHIEDKKAACVDGHP